ncbi:NAD(P)/FAD-dependent oxidoreductase [Gracilimonas tropica]|uniref:NAD(P)/FAD-dependent oxidoreductase n=1 Tax=Gracilimonas tropica TaxID=454600 RepID=UPI000686FAF3|nr:FAD/NAD(P)-binding oxidoreductase [Gracilimonas tropica]
MEKRILVLGGGIGGITVAKELSRKIGNEDGINLAKILIFEREKQNLYYPSLTWVMVGEREPEQIIRNTEAVELNGVEVVFGEIEKIDPQKKEVISNGRSYVGDYLVISLGMAQSDSFGLTKIGHNFYTLEGASSFYDRLQDFEGGKIGIVISSVPYKSPVAPYEAAMLIENYIREQGLEDKTEIFLYSPEERPMPYASDEISGQVEKIMASKGIQYKPNHRLISIDGKELEFKNSTGESSFNKFDLMAFTPNHECPQVIKEAELSGDSGWIEVVRASLQSRFDGVFALGDIAHVLSEKGKVLPKAGIFAQHQAEVIANNIARKLAGKEPNKSFKGEGKYMMDQGGNGASKIGGDFYHSDIDLYQSNALRYWEKVIREKSWFLKNFS